MPRSPVRGNHRNTFDVHHEERITHVRLCQYPDGGMARMRLWGELTERGRDDIVLRWYNLLPAIQVERILGEHGMGAADAEAAAKARPLVDRRDLPEVLAAQLSI